MVFRYVACGKNFYIVHLMSYLGAFLIRIQGSRKNNSARGKTFISSIWRFILSIQHSNCIILLFFLNTFFYYPLTHGAESVKGLSLVRCGTRNMFRACWRHVWVWPQGRQSTFISIARNKTYRRRNRSLILFILTKFRL